MKKENGVLTEATNKDLKLLEENPAKFWEGVTTIGSRAFENCKYLEKIELPEGLTEIEALAFFGCSKLKEIKVPEGVKKLGRWAFAKCSSLERIELPDELTKIGEWAFFKCSKLKEIKVPQGVKRIEIGAFVGCSSLEKIEFPDGIEKIKCSFDTISPEAIIQYKGRTFKNEILSLDEQMGYIIKANEEEFETYITLLNNNIFPSFVDDLTEKAL